MSIHAGYSCYNVVVWARGFEGVFAMVFAVVFEGVFDALSPMAHPLAVPDLFLAYFLVVFLVFCAERFGASYPFVLSEAFHRRRSKHQSLQTRPKQTEIDKFFSKKSSFMCLHYFSLISWFCMFSRGGGNAP